MSGSEASRLFEHVSALELVDLLTHGLDEGTGFDHAIVWELAARALISEGEQLITDCCD